MSQENTINATPLGSKTQDLTSATSTSTNASYRTLTELFPKIKFKHKSMVQILQQVVKISRSNCPALILGESGTGKEHIAEAIHKLSTRHKQSFIAINCSAIPKELLEAELFGYVKGAFTGAETKRIGLFEKANNSSLFLDEIGDMHPQLQAKILRVIQEQTYSPLGSSQSYKTNIRVIAATNKDLEQSILDKTFRLDLYYRLNVLPIKLPSLRERKEDIALLATYFTNKFNQHNKLLNPYHLSNCLIETMMSYHWPGNIRELKNIIERMCTLNNGGLLKREKLPPELSGHQPSLLTNSIKELTNFDPLLNKLKIDLSQGLDLPKVIASIEASLIQEALKYSYNNKSKAAKLLTLNRTTLLEKLKKQQVKPST